MKIYTVAMIAAMAATTMTGFAEGSAADTYKSKCAMCHGADGMASGPAGKAMKVPAITEAVFKAPEANLIESTKKGKGKMPAYAGKLTDSQIKEVVAYMLTLKK
ncbi:MAG TPA: cytochrome c [Rhodanobacter sp.]|nr:cytochrome c [Rhodanobacter sp.]